MQGTRMADCKASAEIIGRVVNSVAACAPGNNPVCRMEVAVADGRFIVVGRGEDITGQFARLQAEQMVKIVGRLVPHRWKSRGGVEHTTVHVAVDVLEVLS